MDPYALQQAPLFALAATVGFFILAFFLLYPIWRFLNREEEVSRRWTPEEIERAARLHQERERAARARDEDPDQP
jgi:hypothetical protein